MRMAMHPLQGPLDALPKYLTDAASIFDVIRERITNQTTLRQSGGGTGGGRPRGGHRSLNRAVVVASVGALEAFTEDLVLTARDLIPNAGTSKPWFHVEGGKGMVQTPNSSNIAKLLWVYFRYDPRPEWDVTLKAAQAELSEGGSLWRGTKTRYTGGAAAEAIDAMVKVRHGFAHQDSSKPETVAGVVMATQAGNLSLGSHHALNSISMVAQISLQMAHGVADLLPGTHPRLRWKKAMTPIEELLVDTPVASDIPGRWLHHPF